MDYGIKAKIKIVCKILKIPFTFLSKFKERSLRQSKI